MSFLYLPCIFQVLFLILSLTCLYLLCYAILTPHLWEIFRFHRTSSFLENPSRTRFQVVFSETKNLPYAPSHYTEVAKGLLNVQFLLFLLLGVRLIYSATLETDYFLQIDLSLYSLFCPFVCASYYRSSAPWWLLLSICACFLPLRNTHIY